MIPWWIPVALMTAGAVAKDRGLKQQGEDARILGERRNAAAVFEAQQLEQNAGQALAASQREALEERRKAKLLSSRMLAVAAASGGGASDNTVLRLMADLAGEGEYRAKFALYSGLERARQLRMGAGAKRYEGAISLEAGYRGEAAAKTARRANLFSTAAGASMLFKYGEDGPPTRGDSTLLATGGELV